MSPRDDTRVAGQVHGALTWKLLSALAVPALGTALMVWRNDSLQDAELSRLRMEHAQVVAQLQEHVRDESRRNDAKVVSEREIAVEFANLQGALNTVKGQIDALLQALSRRRPG